MTVYVLSFHGIPIAVSERRECLCERMARYAAVQQKAMTISDPVEVLK